MTSVPQLPVEATAAKAREQGETPRSRAKQAAEGDERGFAALLALVLPARAVEIGTLEVEGGGVVAEAAEGAAVTDATKAPPPATAVKAVKAAAPTPAPLGMPVAAPAPVEEHPALAPTEQGPKTAAMQAPEVQPAAVVEEAAHAERIEAEDARGSEKQPEHASGRAALVREYETAEARPAARPQEVRRPAGPSKAQPPPVEPVEWKAAAAARAEQQPAPLSAPARPEKQHGPPVPRVEAVAEPKRPEMTGVAKAELARVDETPVIEFQVRPQRLAGDVRQTPVIAGRPTAVAAPPPTAPRQAIVEERSPAGPAMPAEEIEAEPAAMSPLTQRAAAAPALASRTGEAQPELEGSADTPQKQNASVERGAQPSHNEVSGKSITTNLATGPGAEAERSVEVPLKPAVSPASASPVNGLQAVAPAHSTPAEPRPAEPAEEAPPMASANPPREQEIAAKLEQQSGRTTLNVVLQDERLGRVALQLVERGGWIATAIRTSDPRTAQTLVNGAAGLFEALQQRGLALASSGGAATWDAQEGQRRDNPQRDADSPRPRFRLRRSAGEFEGAMARVEA